MDAPVWVLRSLVGMVVVGLLAGCSGAATSSPSIAPPFASTGTISPSAPGTTPTASPTPVPVAATSGTGQQHVVGTAKLTAVTEATETLENVEGGGIGHMRGSVFTLTTAMNDPRVTGDWTVHESYDAYLVRSDSAVGPIWGTATMKNDTGAWEGSCTGVDWLTWNRSRWSCWLTGSGGYKGYTAYLALDAAALHDGTVEGVIYPGSPPKP